MQNYFNDPYQRAQQLLERVASPEEAINVAYMFRAHLMTEGPKKAFCLWNSIYNILMEGKCT